MSAQEVSYKFDGVEFSINGSEIKKKLKTKPKKQSKPFNLIDWLREPFSAEIAVCSVLLTILLLCFVNDDYAKRKNTKVNHRVNVTRVKQ